MSRSGIGRRLRRYRLATAAPRAADGFRSVWTVVDGVRLHARVADPAPGLRPGVGGRPTAVLVHGLAVSHRYLMPTAAALRDRGIDPRVLDLPGFGLSGDPRGSRRRVLDVAEQADALAGWLDATVVGPVVLLGNSFGCQVVVDLASRQPDRCAALVLSGPTMDVVGRTASRQVARWARDLFREDPMQLPIMARDLRDATPQRVLQTLGHALRDPVEAKLATLRVPTLVLRGGSEPIVPARWAQQVTELAPAAQRVDIPGSPHNCVYVAADALADATVDFLRSQRLAARAGD